MYASQRQGAMPSAPRARAVLLLVVLAVLGTLVGLLRAQSEAVGAQPDRKVTICHATSSATNPYVEISVSTNGANGGKLSDHTSHEDDFIPAPAGGCPSTVPPGPGDPGGTEHKVDVCHVTGSQSNPVVMINIAQSAVATHLDHGDYLADAVKGCTITTTDPDDPGTPGKPDEKTPGPQAASVVVTSVPSQSASAPSQAASRTCTSRRIFRIRIRSKRRDPVVRATVSVNGKRVKSVRGKRVTAPVVLRGLPKGQFTVKITATTRKGHKITGTRRYKTCVPKSTKQTIPLL